MGTGLDAQFGAAKETGGYGVREVPTRFFEVIPTLGVNFAREHYVSQGLGGGVWRRKRTQTTRRGESEWQLEVPDAGFGFFLDLFHNQVPAVVAAGASLVAFEQTHELQGAPDKSATVQVGVPQTGATVSPFDYLGVTLRGITFSWESAGVLMAALQVLARDEVTDQSLETPTLAETGMFSFKGGEIALAGAPLADVNGGGNVGFEWPMRDDAYSLGGDGRISKPLPNERPNATGEFTADFASTTHYDRVVSGELADLVLTFVGEEIDATESINAEIEVTIPDCAFTSTAPQVEGPGPVTQTISLESASPDGSFPSIRYVSLDAVV